MTDKPEPVAWNELVEEIRERGEEIVQLSSTVEDLLSRMKGLGEIRQRWLDGYAFDEDSEEDAALKETTDAK